MGKQRKSKVDLGLETSSNLDPQVESVRKKRFLLKNDRMPELLENAPEFINDYSPKISELKQKLFKAHGEMFIDDFPARCICLLIILGADDRQYFGTGFMISPRCVITAGHCLHFGEGWAKEIKVFPGADGPKNNPYGGDVSGVYISTNNWSLYHKPDYDYGAIILPSDNLFNRVRSYLGYGIINKTGPILVGGYPISSNCKQITLHGESQEILPFTITYNISTVRGSSGSPVYILNNNQILVIGLHTYGGNPSHGIRITDQVIAHWQNWAHRQQILV